MDKLNFLIVDDKKIIGDLFDFTLGYRGHQITWASTAKEALDLIEHGKFHIAFIDIVMPDVDGIILLEAIKEHFQDLPVVMMTGYSVQEKQDRAIALGAVACMKKPFEMEEVAEIVKKAIGKDV